MKLLTLKEAATQLGLSVPTIERYVASGRLFSIKLGPKPRDPRRVPENAITEFVEGRIAEARQIATIHPVQAGAPDHREVEGALPATDCEGVSAMHDNLIDPPQPDTERGRQLAAVLKVGKLLELDLPAVWAWTVRAGYVRIQLAPVFDAAEIVDSLKGWAEFLGAVPHADGGVYDTTAIKSCRRVEITAEYRGLNLLVFNGVPVDHIPAEWLADSVTPETAS